MTRRRDSEFERERRKQRRLAQVGTKDWQCLCCGYDKWTGINVHHRAGKIKGTALHEFTWGFCGNDHDDISEAQRALPRPNTCPPSLLYQAGRFLVGRSQELARISHYIEQAAGQALADKRTKNGIINGPYLRELARYQRADADACEALGLRLVVADGKHPDRRTPHKK